MIWKLADKCGLLSQKLMAKGGNERIDAEKSSHWRIPSETRGGSPIGVAMGGERRIQVVDCRKERPLADSIGVETSGN